MKTTFDLHQQVNQYLCIALIALLGFFVVLYYFVHKAEAFGNFYVQATMTVSIEGSKTGQAGQPTK
jgi:hypothetical protein